MLNPVPLPSIETTAVKIAGKAIGKGVAAAPSFAGDLAATLAAMVDGVPFPASSTPQPAAQTVPAPASSLAAHSMPEPNIILPAPPQTAGPNLVHQKAGKAEPSPTPSPVPLSNGSTDPNNGPPNAFPTGNELFSLAEAPLSSNSNPAIGQEAPIENTNSPKKADKKANESAHGSKKADLPLPSDTGMPLSNTPPAAVPLPVVVTIAPTSSTPQLAQNVAPETEAGREVAPPLTPLAAPTSTPTPTPLPQANAPAEPVNLGDKGAGLMPRKMDSGSSHTDQATGAVHRTIDDGTNTGQPIPIVASDPPALRKGALSSNAIKLAEKSRSATEKSTQGRSLAVPFQRSDGPDLVNPSQFVASTGPTPTAPLEPSSLAPPLPPSPGNDQHTLNLSAGPVPYGMLPMEIGLGALQGQRALEVRLSPEDLGTVEIRLEVSDDSKVKAKITADRPETLAMMIGDASLIRNALDQSGLTTNADSLQFSLKQDNTAAGNGNGNGNGAQQQQNGHSQSQSRNGSPPPPFQESIPLTTLRRAAGLLDVNI